MTLTPEPVPRPTTPALLRGGWTAAYDWAARRADRAAYVAIAFLVLEFLLFRTSYTANMAPYYPAGFDQLSNCEATYQAVLAVRDFGLGRLFHGPLLLHALMFKGWV